MFWIIPLCLIIIYFYATKNHDYWEKRKVKHITPIPFFGNYLKNLLGFRHITQTTIELYNRYPNEKVIGYYRGTTPVLIVKDPDIIKDILDVNFKSFYARGLGRDHDLEPLMYNIFHLDGDLWKLLRQRLMLAFTTAKLKNMFPLIVSCAEKLQGLGDEIVTSGGECDVRELMARFTTEIIGACGFGIKMDTDNNEHSLFIELVNNLSRPLVRNAVLLSLCESVPCLRKNLYAANKAAEVAIIKIITTIRKQRYFKRSGRNDFIDLLMELEGMGKMKGESIEKSNADGTPAEVEAEVDIKFMAAQTFLFFAAGFETSSSAMSFALHQLSFHPEVQTKVQEEVDNILLKYKNKLCYNAVAEMNYLDMVFKESMRLFSIVGTLNRVCTRTYKIPRLNVIIDPGVKILIPSQALHMDEKYYEDPKEFKPERFTPAAVRRRHKYAYLPFGEGQRNCIGARMGQMQSLAGLAAILQKFSVVPSISTRRELRADPHLDSIQSVVGGMPLRLVERKTKRGLKRH